MKLEWRDLFYRGPPKISKNKKNTLRTFPLVRNFPLKVAANFLELSSGAFIEKVSPFMRTLKYGCRKVRVHPTECGQPKGNTIRGSRTESV